MINIKDPLVQLKITSAACSFFAIASTLYRLWLRRSRLWVDDLAAAFALLTLVIQIVSVFLHLPVPNSQSQTTRVAVYYTMAYAFYTVIFFSRLSILFSIIRIDSSQRRRRYLHGAAIFIVAALLFLMAQLLWVCEPEPSWKLAANPQCKLPLQVAVCQLVTDVIIDGILLAAPLTLLRHLADKRLRRKLTVIFSTCVATTIVSLVHAAYILSKGGIKVLISALVEDTCSLIVANLPVLIGATFRIHWRRRSRSDSRLDTNAIYSSQPDLRLQSH
ncbi:hypothetical protein DL96DRAFT_21641 [Flagelloscypha sp. PMI_526]|nr:hypothetical protein DL96DRAFT_21641 [Flagelloscypha sp. PMI_526]